MSDVLQTIFIEGDGREIPRDEMPIPRLLSKGAEALKNSELLAVIAGISNDLAERVLIKYTNVEGIARATLPDLARIKGMGNARAAAIQAAFALGARLSKTAAACQTIDKPEHVYSLLGEEMRLLHQESVRVILLNTKFQLIAVEEVSRGTLDSVMAHPREVFGPAISRQAYAVILVHNHPSGDPTPSLADHQITTQLKKASDYLQIKFFDHVVLGAPRLQESQPYYSFREGGYL